MNEKLTLNIFISNLQKLREEYGNLEVIFGDHAAELNIEEI